MLSPASARVKRRKRSPRGLDPSTIPPCAEMSHLTDPSMESRASTTPTGEISLAALLNVLWRRRWLVLLPPIAGWLAGLVYGFVMPPLYAATATVRPGITAFSPDGGGQREWRLKDIKSWYDGRLYRHGVAERMGITPREAPSIRAQFIERGLQNIQGGNVVTLRCLDPDPERAARALDASIAAFEDYVEADSLSSSISLTRRGLQIQIAEQERQLDALDTKAEVLRLQLQKAQADSVHVEVGEVLTRYRIEDIEAGNDRMLREMQAIQELRNDLTARLAELEKAIEKSPLYDTNDSAPPNVRPAALLTETEVYRGLLESAIRLRSRLYRTEIRADSLQHRIDSAEGDVKALLASETRDLQRDRAGVLRDVADVRIQISRAIPEQQRGFQLEIRSRQVQLSTLSPLERVGTTTSSDGPVRPRKRRAIMILTFLGLVGGIALAYVWDYLSRHRREIFAS